MRLCLRFLAPLAAVAVLTGSLPSTASARTTMFCADNEGRSYVPKSHPRSCTVFGPGGTFGGGVNLAKLRWKGWGGVTARATGLERGFHRPLSRIRVTVTLTRVRNGRCGRTYGQLVATSKYGTTVRRLARCPRSTF